LAPVLSDHKSCRAPEDLSFPACGVNTTASSDGLPSVVDRSIRPAENLSPSPAAVALASKTTPDVPDALEAGEGTEAFGLAIRSVWLYVRWTLLVPNEDVQPVDDPHDLLPPLLDRNCINWTSLGSNKIRV
jgi:hypothetical protein